MHEIGIRKNRNISLAVGRKHYSRLGETWHRLCKNKAALAGLFILIVVLLSSLSADLYIDYKTEVINPNISERLRPPDGEHILGTDELGRDILARLVYGSRMSLMIGALGVTFSLAIGIILGSISAYYGGAIDIIMMRICDVFEGLPSFMLALVITAAFGTNLFTLMLAIAGGAFATLVRIMRGTVLTIKENEYIEAARAVGANNFQIITYHILPNCAPTIIVQATIRIGMGICTASALSFLGLGVQPPAPEWGTMLSGGRKFLLEAPHLTMFPGLAIMVTILSFNLLGDGLRDALDPRLRQ